MKRLLGPLFTATLLIPTAVHAGTFFDKYFAGAEGGKTCYTRIYDEQHLKIHPRQRVTQIVLAFDIAKPGGSKPLDGHKFEVALGLRVKDATALFLSPAYCSTERSGVVCHVEGDGGTFRIGPGSNDGLTIEVMGDGLRFEGENDAIEVGVSAATIIASACRASTPRDAASGSGVASSSEKDSTCVARPKKKSTVSLPRR